MVCLILDSVSIKSRNYDLERFLPASIRRNIKSRMVNPHKDEPPQLKNGRGIPITGVSPSTIPTLMNTWNRKILSTEYPQTLPKRYGCRSARWIRRSINARKRTSTPAEPRKPSSSPTVQKIKSVSCSGTYLSFVCVPLRNPLPLIPPEPIAI